MAAAVGRALTRGEPLIVEAGTGIGKTFAYLVPALLSGLHVIISTGTRTLQDQLFHRDVPLLARALGMPVKMALLKGRANYLCRHRLELATVQKSLFPRRARNCPAAREGVEVGRRHQVRRPLRAHRPAGAIARMASDDLDPRKLSRPGMPAILALPRDGGAPRRSGRPGRGRESSSAARGSRAQGRGIRRSVARRAGRHSGRGPPGAGDRRSILWTDLVGSASAALVAGCRGGDEGCRRAGARGCLGSGRGRVAPRRAPCRASRRCRTLRVGESHGWLLRCLARARGGPGRRCDRARGARCRPGNGELRPARRGARERARIAHRRCRKRRASAG